MIERTPLLQVVLAAGGTGSRMGARVPKQYLPVHNKPIVLYSFELFLSLQEVEEIVVVCEEAYRYLFTQETGKKKVFFASPGTRRQDSVFNGINALTYCPDSLICIHDAARPCIDADLVRRVASCAAEYGAAVAGMPVKGTIKMCDVREEVLSTLPRASLREMQTPQIIRADSLKDAYKIVHRENLEVTDDVSLIELLGLPVKVVTGSGKNIKVTTPEDLVFVTALLEKYVLL